MKFTSKIRDEIINSLELSSNYLPEDLRGKALDLAAKVRRLETPEQQSVSVPEMSLCEHILHQAREYLDPSPSNFNRHDSYICLAMEKRYGLVMWNKALARVRAETGWK